MNFLTIAAYFGAAGVIIVTSGLVWRVMFRPVVHEIREIGQDRKELAAVIPVVHKIMAELHVDGGHSIKDTVNEISATATDAKTHAEHAVRVAVSTAADVKTQIKEFEKHTTEKFVIIAEQLTAIQATSARRRGEFQTEGGTP